MCNTVSTGSCPRTCVKGCKLLILADDLTGTADSAVGCAAAGLSATVMLSINPSIDSDVIAIDTDSRAYPPHEAAQCNAKFLRRWQGRYNHLYKKMDSTLRGNVAAELAALIPIAGMAIVAPAYPATGRTTRDGQQYLNGQPVETCEIWTNEGIKGRANLVAMLRDAGLSTALLTIEQLHHSAESVRKALVHWQQAGIQAVVCDALTDKDLEHLAHASATLEHAFWAGSAGLGQHLPEALGLTVGAPASNTFPTVKGSTLIVVGSMSSISHIQADALQADGGNLMVIDIGADQLRKSVSLPSWNALQERIQKTLIDGHDLLVRQVQGEEPNVAEGPQLSQQLGQLLAPVLPFAGRLIATGGATARALLIKAGVTHLRLLNAPDVGMVRMSTIYNGHRLEVITKAGGFGDRDALLRAWQSERSKRFFSHHPENSLMTDRPVIGITMGDAAGVGPEIIIKSLAHSQVYNHCRALVIGDAGRLRDAISRLESDVTVRAIETPSQARFKLGTIDCIDMSLIPETLPYGEVSPIAGDAAYQFIARTVELARSGELDAICTAPLNKEALHAGGHIFPGHTELLAHLTDTEEVSMMLVTPKMKVIHVTTHMGLIDAIHRIEPGLVQRTIERAHATLSHAGINNPRIAVCGINPHAGENGLFGNGEEEEKIVPAIEALQARGWNVEGPLPADTLFFRAGRGDFDCVVAMYHDQGHGPVKVLGLEAGVNVTVGLPVVRTSVDHGTAFDIAGQGLADERSLLEALRQAVELASRYRCKAD